MHRVVSNSGDIAGLSAFPPCAPMRLAAVLWAQHSEGRACSDLCCAWARTVGDDDRLHVGGGPRADELRHLASVLPREH